MNFYKRFMGDYAKKTGRLSLAQHGAYNVLLDEQYASEAGLPVDLEELHRICRAMSDEERQAVDFIAERFFPVSDDGLRWNERAHDEILTAQPLIAAARDNGKRGGRPKKQEPSENPMGLQPITQTKPSAKASQSQISPSLRSGDNPPKPKSESITLTTYLARCKAEGRKPIPEDHPLRSYCADAGITTEMMQIAWLMFKDRHTDGEKGKRKRYKDWPKTFQNSIEGRWYGLWIVNAEGACEWSNTGLQQKRVLEARLKKSEAGNGA